MRLIGAASIVYVVAIAFGMTGSAPAVQTPATAAPSMTGDSAPRRDGQDIFRYDTFGDEQLWTDVLRMQEAIAKVDPATALAVGLKVDVDALPPASSQPFGPASRSHQPCGHDRTLEAERSRRREGNGQRGGRADTRRHHLRAVPFIGRRLVRARDRQASRWLGQHRSERWRDCRPVAGAGRRDQGGIPRHGARASTIRVITRSTARISFR